MGSVSEALSGYALIYRAYNHGGIRAVCAALNAVPLGANLQRQLHTTAISQEMRDFASGFLALHEYRHRADYGLAGAGIRKQTSYGKQLGWIRQPDVYPSPAGPGR